MIIEIPRLQLVAVLLDTQVSNFADSETGRDLLDGY